MVGWFDMAILISCFGRTRTRMNWFVSLFSPSGDRGFGVLHGFYGWVVLVFCMVFMVGRLGWLVSSSEDRGFGVLHGFHGWSVGVVGWLDMSILISCFGHTQTRMDWFVSLVSPSGDRGFGVLHGFCGWSVGVVGWLVGWGGRVVGWLVGLGWLGGWSVGVVGWLGGWVVGWLGGWVVRGWFEMKSLAVVWSSRD